MITFSLNNKYSIAENKINNKKLKINRVLFAIFAVPETQVMLKKVTNE